MKLAFIGLGAIGKPMSERLLDKGYDLNLYQRNKRNKAGRHFGNPQCWGLLLFYGE